MHLQHTRTNTRMRYCTGRLQESMIQVKQDTMLDASYNCDTLSAYMSCLLTFVCLQVKQDTVLDDYCPPHP